ncbi:hypothetical protein ACEQPO_17855 [Bacillus sp. SL00103]
MRARLSIKPQETMEGYWKRKIKNKLLTGLYQCVSWRKTGYTKLAKRTLVLQLQRESDADSCDDDTPDDWKDHISMFEYAFDHYKTYVLAEKRKTRFIKETFYEKKKLFIKRDVDYF